MDKAQFAKLFAALGRTRTNYAECVKITRTDGTVFRFTGHDSDLSFVEPNGTSMVTYRAADSFAITALEMQSGLKVNNMDIDAIISDDALVEADLRGGKFDEAKLEIFLAYWSSREIKVLPLRVSWIGELQIEGDKFRADLRGIAGRLASVFTKQLSLTCRYNFGDSNCGVDLTPYELVAPITSVISQESFRCFNIDANDYENQYQWGLVTFLDGPLTGQTMEIYRQYGTRIDLFLPMEFAFTETTSVRLRKGCDKTPFDCRRFGNFVNYGGEPYIAGSDKLMAYPTRSK